MGWRMPARPTGSGCLCDDDQRGVRVSADGDGEAEGEGETYEDAEEGGETLGDAAGPVVVGAVVSVVIRWGVGRGSACLGGVVPALVVSSVVLPSASVSSGAVGFVRSTYGWSAGDVSEDVPFGGVSSAAANASAPTNATPKSAGASTRVRGKSAREATTLRSARYAARTHPGRHAKTTSQESKCSGMLPSSVPERIASGERVG